MKVIDRAKAHFDSFGIQSMEVEEWLDENNNPTKIYWNPMTLAERSKLVPNSEAIQDIALMAKIIVSKSLDKDGNKLFAPEDLLSLKHKVDAEVIGKIAARMCSSPTPDDQKKNLKLDLELSNVMSVADRLKMSMTEVLNMSVYEFNTWLGYLLNEQEVLEEDKRRSMHR